jgi:hypothetical protein
MESFPANIRRVFCALAVASAIIKAEAQEKSMLLPGPNSIFLPAATKPWKSSTAVSVLFTQLPFDWVETSVEVPLFQLNNRLALPYGLSLESSLQTIFVSNQLRTGLRWNYASGKYSFSAGIDAALLLGRMKVAGFNNSAWGLSIYPVVSAGYIMKKARITMVAEYCFLNTLRITSGSTEISHQKNFSSGPCLAFYTEEPLWKDHIMIIGIVNNFQKFYFPAWPAFSTFNRRYYIPQIHIGLLL